MIGPQAAIPAPPVAARSRSRAIMVAMGFATVAWMLQMISGFRLPWNPIVVSDGDSGAGVRQIVFSLASLLGVLWLLRSARLAEITRGRSAVIMLLVWTSASVIYSAEPGLTVKRSIILLFCAFLLTAMVAAAPRPVDSVGRWITAVTAITAWLSVAGSITLPAECWSIAERPGLAGLTGHPNQLGGIVGIGLVVSLGVRCRAWGRLALLTAQVGLVLALLMSKSMTCLTFTLAGVAIFAALRARPALRAAVVTLTLPLLAVIACIGLGVLRDDALAAAGKDASLTGRTELWSIVSREIGERPVLGVGFGAFWREGKGRELVGTWNPRQSHQAYLDLLLDLGLVGLGLVAALVFSGTLAPLIAMAARGVPPPAQQAALVAMVFALCGVYSLGESFMLRADKFPFFAMLWSILAMTDARSSVEPAVKSCEGHTQQLRGLTC